MQFISNYLLIRTHDRRSIGSRYFICLGLLLITGLVCDTVSGQHRVNRQALHIDGNEFFQPHHFGDTPSPTEMMARLKYHKQQETPLFDLLREAGVDIFSKLSEDEQKLAGRFVEDMILKEGLDSEKFSSLREKMNIGDETIKALQDGIDRAGIGESAISPEQRKELADNIRKNFPQRSESQQDIFKSPTNRNWRQPEERMPRDLATEQDREAFNKLRQELEHERANQLGDPSQQQPSNLANRRASERVQREAEQLREARRQARELAGPGTVTNPHFRQPRVNQTSREQRDPTSRNLPPLPNNSAQTPNRDLPINAVPPTDSFQSQPAKQALDQLESRLNESQRKIVSEFRNRIRRGDISSQEIGELLQDLKKPESTGDFARQLDKVGEKFDLPAESREEIQEAFSGLSRADRGSLEQAFDAIDDGILEQLANKGNGRLGGGPNSRGSNRTSTRAAAVYSELVASQIDNIQKEQLAKDFLKGALESYNDAESGYELPPAFKQLKDRAEGRHSDREMANLGNLSKKLFEESANIFDPKSSSNNRRPGGVKPGQRLDQLLAAAADKALAGDSSDGESKSLFSDAFNNALGAALDQAVNIADKDAGNRNRNTQEEWFPENNLNTENQFDSLESYDGIQFTTEPESTSNNSPTSTNSNDEISMNDAAAAIADSVSEIEFNGWTLMYAVGLIALLAGAVFLLFRLLPPTDESAKKQRELQRKLQSNLSKPKDVVEAVDLFLISRFGAAATWWNAKHAADQISTDQPDWRDKVVSLFQVYRWSRYQADGNARVSSEQNELVNSTLQELSQAPEDAFGTATSIQEKTIPAQSSTAEVGGTS